MEKNEIINLIRNILIQALNGNLYLPVFYDVWPNEVNNNPWFETIYEDLEEAIQHTPGFFIKKGVDYNTWCKSYEYHVLIIDYLLLKYSDKEEKILLQCKKHVVSTPLTSKERIEEEINRYFQV